MKFEELEMSEAENIVKNLYSSQIGSVVDIATQLYELTWHDNADKVWCSMCYSAALFEAGRRQGIREERSRRRTKSDA